MLRASIRICALAALLITAPAVHNRAATEGVQGRASRPEASARGYDAQLSRARLLAAARAGGDYLVRMQKPDGSFHYIYDAANDSTSARGYNVVRHAGAAFSLFDLYEATRARPYLEAAGRAVNYLKSRFRPARERNSVYLLDNDGKAKLGAAGLALVAMAEQIRLDPKTGDKENAARLANHILAMQNADGSFESYYPVRGDEPRGSISLYYPGEAILGLVKLYGLNRDRRLLDSARRGAKYLIESQRRMGELPPDAWLMQALEALFKIERDRLYAQHAIALAESMIADQYGEGDPDGFAGGFGPAAPRATPAASRAEGMIASYRLARATADPRAPQIARAIKLAARFQLSQQFDKRGNNELPNPERASGGFREHTASARVRIDFVQHNICSLLGVAETLY